MSRKQGNGLSVGVIRKPLLHKLAQIIIVSRVYTPDVPKENTLWSITTGDSSEVNLRLMGWEMNQQVAIDISAPLCIGIRRPRKSTPSSFLEFWTLRTVPTRWTDNGMRTRGALGGGGAISRQVAILLRLVYSTTRLLPAYAFMDSLHGTTPAERLEYFITHDPGEFDKRARHLARHHLELKFSRVEVKDGYIDVSVKYLPDFMVDVNSNVDPEKKIEPYMLISDYTPSKPIPVAEERANEDLGDDIDEGRLDLSPRFSAFKPPSLLFDFEDRPGRASRRSSKDFAAKRSDGAEGAIFDFLGLEDSNMEKSNASSSTTTTTSSDSSITAAPNRQRRMTMVDMASFAFEEDSIRTSRESFSFNPFKEEEVKETSSSSMNTEIAGRISSEQTPTLSDEEVTQVFGK